MAESRGAALIKRLIALLFIAFLSSTTAGGNDGTLADKLYNEGLAILSTSQNEQGILEAISKLEEACSEYEKTGDKKGAANALINTGVAYHRIGDFETALDRYQRALALYRDPGVKSRPGEANALSNIGSVYHALGALRNALSSHEQGIEIWEEIKEPLGIADSLINIGNIYRETGDIEQAVRLHERAYEIIRQKGNNTEGEASALTSIGNDYFSIGGMKKALMYFEDSLQLRTESKGDIQGIGNTLGNIGVVYQATGELKKALKYFEDSLKIRRALGNDPSTANTLLNMAVNYQSAGEYDKAMQFFSEALTLCEKAGFMLCEANAYGGIGLLHQTLLNNEKALSFLKKAVELSEALESPSTLWRWQRGIGSALCREKKFEEAVEFYKKAVETIESQVSEMKSDEFAVSFMEDKLWVYEELIYLLLDMGRPEEAFYFLEKMRGMSLRGMLERGKVDILQRAPEELRDEITALRDQIGSIHTRIIETMRFGESETRSFRVKMLRQALLEATERYDDLLRKTTIMNPDLALLATGRDAVDLKEIQDRILDERTVLFEYFAGARGMELFVVGRKRFAAIDLGVGAKAAGLSEDMLAEQVNAFLDTMKPASLAADPAPGLKTHAALGGKLYEILIQPGLKYLNAGDRILIVPDGVLHYLPFEALIAPENEAPPARETKPESGNFNNIVYSEYESIHYLIKDHAVFYAPSATVLGIQKKKNIPSLTALGPREMKLDGELAAFGDPYFSSGETAELSGELIYDRWNEDSRAVLGRLPGTKREVEAAAGFFDKSRVFTGGDASEETAKKNMADKNAVFFATHGTLNADDPLSSGLALSEIGFRLDGKTTMEDGILTAREIFRDPEIKLSADLVALSACNTARGRILRGEGVIGLPRAFIFAGANNVVVSLWSVEDASTAELMTEFTRNLALGMDKAEALRQAKLSLMKTAVRVNQGGADSQTSENQMSHAHPFFWAPFIIIGSGL